MRRSSTRCVNAVTDVFHATLPRRACTRSHITWDEEHAAYRVLFERAREGMSSRLMLDTPMVTSAEYRELRARGQVTEAARSAAISDCW